MKTKDKLWKVFSEYIRTRDSIKTTGSPRFCICVTCGKLVENGTKFLNAGHYLSGRTGKNLFDERGVHGQCVGCNCFGNGKPQEYTEFMLREYGADVVAELSSQKWRSYKYSVAEMEEMISIYQEKTARLIDEQ